MARIAGVERVSQEKISKSRPETFPETNWRGRQDVTLWVP